MVLAGLGLGLFMTHLVPVQGILIGELQKGYWLGFMAIFLLPLTPFRLLAHASQRSYFANVFIMFQSLLITGLALLLAWKGFAITGQLLAVLAGNIGFQALICWDGLRRYQHVFSAIKDHKAHIPI
jgi:hypothetical protein